MEFDDIGIGCAPKKIDFFQIRYHRSTKTTKMHAEKPVNNTLSKILSYLN